MRLQFEFKAVASPRDSKTTVTAVISVATEQRERYAIPGEYIYGDFHKELLGTDAFKKVTESLERRHDEVRLWITTSKELKKIYVDDEGNMHFGGRFLKQIARESNKENSDLTRILKQIVKKFALGKFNYTTCNLRQWLDTFEMECDRFSIGKDKTKIELLRSLLDENLQDWYTSTVIKEENEND
ncbi:PREDICTED: uncharacterized protein LOC107070852 [Polistes dominula]|uniref:Uncharacterized protein LOC107070852 n=1 Tax=Polistes dominula TaxID=743375 RepID=A0ABM1IXE5_POLDO|nr:PREDICTED: uncharacterized protein LOC107070852 [Polistes dominula]XP_015184881.1 PREDICTED: uncharacterized protein LOC107070852 [Polistes dominula]XP_015184882.1 PREDICTED: uncharacterized protein LOC107070852 [Polistes dominula]XP_015184883.1 PREDICTED: uncharacterized protein LOC107070852 [Polistes dominula]